MTEKNTPQLSALVSTLEAKIKEKNSLIKRIANVMQREKGFYACWLCRQENIRLRQLEVEIPCLIKDIEKECELASILKETK